MTLNRGQRQCRMEKVKANNKEKLTKLERKKSSKLKYEVECRWG